MPRLIDANEILKSEHQHYDYMADEYYVLVRDIENAPTVDAEPVKHGHWVDMGDFESCSVCNGTHLKEYQTYHGKCLWVKMDYCPHCGAKMDVETGNTYSIGEIELPIGVFRQIYDEERKEDETD